MNHSALTISEAIERELETMLQKRIALEQDLARVTEHIVQLKFARLMLRVMAPSGPPPLPNNL